jgi:hypothetical protein
MSSSNEIGELLQFLRRALKLARAGVGEILHLLALDSEPPVFSDEFLDEAGGPATGAIAAGVGDKEVVLVCVGGQRY